MHKNLHEIIDKEKNYPTCSSLISVSVKQIYVYK